MKMSFENVMSLGQKKSHMIFIKNDYKILLQEKTNKKTVVNVCLFHLSLFVY